MTTRTGAGQQTASWWYYFLFVAVLIEWQLPFIILRGVVAAPQQTQRPETTTVRELLQKTASDVVTQNGLLKPAIVEGTPAPNDRYPYMASLNVDPTDFEGGHLCGAAVSRLRFVYGFRHKLRTCCFHCCCCCFLLSSLSL